jgi:hypothetical protein
MFFGHAHYNALLLRLKYRTFRVHVIQDDEQVVFNDLPF